MMNRDLLLGIQAQESAKADGGEDWAAHAWKYPTAVIGDLGQTVINSAISAYNFIAPEEAQAEHVSKYALMSNDVQAYAEEHPDAVAAGSFVAGMVIPGLGVSKAFNLARTGSGVWNSAFRGLGLGYFDTKITAASARATQLALRASGETTAYDAAIRAGKFWTGAEAFAENVAFEATFSLLMQDHAYMEEGWNGTLAAGGIALGTALGTVVKWAKVSNELHTAVSAARKDQLTKQIISGAELQYGSIDILGKNYGWGAAVDGYNTQLAGIRQAEQSIGMDPTAGQWVKDVTSHVKLQTEGRLQQAFDALATPEMRALVPKRKSEAPLPSFNQLEEAAQPLHDGRLAAGSTHYIQPDKYRMTANWLTGQPGQAVGVQQAVPRLSARPIEAGVSPFHADAVTGAEHAVANQQLKDMLEAAAGGHLTINAPTAPVAGTIASRYTAQGKFNFSAIDSLAKVYQDAVSGIWHFDLGAVKASPDQIAAYLAMQVDKKAAVGITVLAPLASGGKRGTHLDSIYRAAVAKSARKLEKIELNYDTAAEALADIPSFAGQYQTLRWFDGRTLSQSSVEAHMTKQFGHMAKPGEADFRANGEYLAGLKAQAGKQPLSASKYSPIDLQAGPARALLPTYESDAAYISSILGFEKLLPASAGKGKASQFAAGAIKIDPTDAPRVQAAIANGIEIDGVPEAARLTYLRDAKLAAVREVVMAVPDMDNFAVALHTNTPVEMVQLLRDSMDLSRGAAYHSANASLADVTNRFTAADFMVYRTAADARKAIADPSVSLIGKNSNVMPDGSLVAAKLDMQTLDRAAREIVDITSTGAIAAATAQGVNTALLDGLYKGHVNNPSIAAIRDGVKTLWDETKIGSLFQSTDMSMRRYKELVAHITDQGQQLQDIVNKQGILPMKAALRDTLTKVSENQSDLIQFEYVQNALAATGARDYDLARGLTITHDNRILLRPEANGIPASYMQYPGVNGAQDIVLTTPVRNLLEQVQVHAAEIHAINSTTAQLQGKAAPVARKLWLPPHDASQDMQAFAWNQKTGQIERITGKDRAAFNQAVADFKQQNAVALQSGELQVHMRNRQDLGTFMRLKNLHDLQAVSAPLPSMRKAGIAGTKVTGNPDVLNRLLDNMEAQYNSAARSYLRIANADILSKLDDIEKLHYTDTASGANNYMTRAQRTTSPATIAKAALLNQSLQGESAWVKSVDDVFSMAVDQANLAIKRGWEQAQQKLGKGVYSPEVFQQLDKDLQAAGIPTPWKSSIEYAVSAQPELRPIAKQFVSASSNVAATLALRLFDSSHAIVTTLSAPVIMAAELTGASKLTHGKAYGLLMESARDWMRQANNGGQAAPYWRQIMEEAKQLGYTSRKTSEATEALLNNFGTKTWWDRFQATKGFEWATKISDFSESMTREMAYMTGYKLALQQTPNAAKELLQAQAALFTNRTMGNYASRQRPIFFQGAAGQAIGLFQTFMWTMGQNLYRYSEQGSLRAISGMLGGYAGMFGISSLPMYNVVDKAIGAYTSAPDNSDITQTMYAAFGGKGGSHTRTGAEFLLYGIPSTLLQTSFWTRGDLQPRLPLTSGGLPLPPALSMLQDTFDTLATTASKTKQIATTSQSPWQGMNDIAYAVGEGIAMQHSFRPAARAAELALGYSVDKKSETILSGDDVRGFWPVFARLLASRPLQEQVIRNQNFRSTYYHTVERQQRQQVTQAMRTLARSGGDMGQLMGNYLQRGGSLQSWRAASQEAYLTADGNGADNLIRSATGQPGIAAIMEGYAF